MRARRPAQFTPEDAEYYRVVRARAQVDFYRAVRVFQVRPGEPEPVWLEQYKGWVWPGRPAEIALSRLLIITRADRARAADGRWVRLPCPLPSPFLVGLGDALVASGRATRSQVAKATLRALRPRFRWEYRR